MHLNTARKRRYFVDCRDARCRKRAESSEVRVASYEMRVASCELQGATFFLKGDSCEFLTAT